MHKIELHPTIRQILKIFERVGIWQNDTEPANRKAVKKFFYSTSFALLPIFLATYSFLSDDQTESIFLVVLAILAAIIFLKCLYLFQKNDVLAFLYDPILCHATDDREEYNRFNQMNKNFMKFVHVFVTSIMTTQAINILYAIFTSTTTNEKTLPLFISFRWNDADIIFSLSFAFISLSITLSNLIGLFTAILWYVLFRHSLGFQLLGSKFRNLGHSVSSRLTVKAREELFVGNLIDLVKAHQHLAK